jgi:signal transduction histidine kinase
MPVREDDVELDITPRSRERSPDDLLGRIAIALASTMDFKETLQILAEMVREVSAAQRCSVVLLEGRDLVPAVSVGPRPDEDLWAAFRSMAPIHVSDEHWRLLGAGHAVAVLDAREEPMIPRTWVERFGLRTVVVVPLVAHGEPCGAMAVDWPEVRAVPDDELAMLEAIATYAGLAVHNARMHANVGAQTHALARLVDVAAALNSSSSLASVLELICDAFESLLGATHCSVNLTDPADPLKLRTLATRGEPWFTRLDGVEVVPPEALAMIGGVRRSSAGPIVYGALDGGEPGVAIPKAVRSAALFPLFGPDGMIGSVVTGFRGVGGPRDADLEAGQTLAELAATAITRADLDDHLRRHLRQIELLYRLSEVVAGTAPLNEVMATVNLALADDLGIRLEAVVVDDLAVAEALGARQPHGPQVDAVDAWRSELAGGAGTLGMRQAGDQLLVPLVHHRRVIGALVVGTDRSVPMVDEEFLLTVASACAEVLHRTALSRAIVDGERHVAVATERERIARDLHGSAGQLMAGIGLRVASWIDEAPDPTWRHRLRTVLRLAHEGERELREAVYALSSAEIRRRGLSSSLRELAERFESTTGIATGVVVDGGAVSMAPDREDALLRVAHEALCDIDRHAEASRVEMHVAHDGASVTLVIQDDGAADRGEGEPGGGGRRAAPAASDRIRELGGTLRRVVTDGGSRVEVRVECRGGGEHRPAEG